MPLLNQGRIIPDPWSHLDDSAPLPANGAVIISLGRWRSEHETLLAAQAATGLTLGLRLENHQSPMDIGDDLAAFEVIELSFPKFGDGRAYSQAHRLKERLGFAGEIRARGDLLRDQFRALYRCGIDTLVFSDDLAAERAARDWTTAIDEFRHAYQPAVRGPEPIVNLRHRRRVAA